MNAQRGSVLVWLPVLLVLASMLATITIDLGGHLVAISRAATAADSAALAAVSADATPAATSPHDAAAEVSRAAGARLETCVCAAGSARARVRVSVEVPGLVWPRLGADRQSAEAEAQLQPRAPPAAVTRTLRGGESDGLLGR